MRTKTFETKKTFEKKHLRVFFSGKKFEKKLYGKEFEEEKTFVRKGKSIPVQLLLAVIEKKYLRRREKAFEKKTFEKKKQLRRKTFVRRGKSIPVQLLLAVIEKNI